MTEKKIKHWSLENNDSLYETTYCPDKKQSFLATVNNGQVETHTSVEIDDTLAYPGITRDTGVISSGFLKIPDHVGELFSTADLVEEVSKFIAQYVELDEDFLLVATYYVLMTWLHERFQVIPYLRVIGDYGSGKSRFLDVVGSLCYHSYHVRNITTASLYRIMDGGQFTLVMDEADMQYSDLRNAKVQILNVGYQKGGCVVRTEKTEEGFEPKTFNVFGAKLLATRERFSDSALESRCLSYCMKTMSQHSPIPIQLGEGYEKALTRLQGLLLRWRLEHYLQTNPSYQVHPILSKLTHRTKQISMPIMEIASEKHVPVIASYLEKHERYLTEVRDDSKEALVVDCLFRNQKAQKITVGDLARIVNGYLSKPEQMSPRGMGSLLRSKLHLQPKKTNGANVIDYEQNQAMLDSLYVRYGVVDEWTLGASKELEINKKKLHEKTSIE